MPTPNESPTTSDVPAEIFAAFLAALKLAEVPPAKIEALRKVLLEKRDFTTGAIEKAMRTEETLP